MTFAAKNAERVLHFSTTFMLLSEWNKQFIFLKLFVMNFSFVRVILR